MHLMRILVLVFIGVESSYFTYGLVPNFRNPRGDVGHRILYSGSASLYSGSARLYSQKNEIKIDSYFKALSGQNYGRRVRACKSSIPMKLSEE